MTASMEIAFWYIAPCSVVEVDRCFRDAYYGLHQRERSVLYPEGGKLQSVISVGKSGSSRKEQS
jgi:hypothetical protein